MPSLDIVKGTRTVDVVIIIMYFCQRSLWQIHVRWRVLVVRAMVFHHGNLGSFHAGSSMSRVTLSLVLLSGECLLSKGRMVYSIRG